MMLDLDNLDLELDEDFPSGPFDNSNLFESSFTGSLPWTGSENDENSECSKIKTGQKANTENIPKKDTNDTIFQHFVSEENKEEMDSVKEIHNILQNNINTSNAFNSSFSPKQIFNNDWNDLNRTRDSRKRLLTHRKFPGPAGLLPDKPLKDLSDINIFTGSSMENVTAKGEKEAFILCSQTSSVFAEPSFKKLASDFDLMKDNCPLNKYTVDWVKKRALKKILYSKKIPFLAAVLHNLDHTTPDPVITLRDQTGEIYGTLHREVWSDLGGKLQPGAALALRQVGVLITGIARRQVHLNITSNNIINIYSYANEEIVETNCVNKVNKSDLIKSVTDWQISVPSKEPKVASNPFSILGGCKPNHNAPCFKTKPSIISVSNNRDYSKNNNKLHNRTSTEHPSSSKNFEPKNCTDFMTAMEDDMSDFLASLDDSNLGEKFLDGMKDSSASANVELESNIRKRKIYAEEVIPSNKVHRPVSREKVSYSNGYVPPAKKMEFQEKSVLISQSLSQAESQLVEEVLEGIDFDDFDN